MHTAALNRRAGAKHSASAGPRPRPTRPLTLAVRWPPAPGPPIELLTPGERRAAAGLSAHRRRHWTAAHLTAHVAVHMLLGRDPADLEILNDAAGAPLVAGEAAKHVMISLSHCEGWTACACAPVGVGVGVDVELADACDAATLARVAAPGERARAEPPTFGWTRKEAAFKACHGDPSVLTCYRLEDGGQVTALRPGCADAMVNTWSIQLPGAVLTTASLDRRAPQLRVVPGERLLSLLAEQRHQGK